MVNSNQNRVNHLRVKKRKVFIRKLPDTATERMIRDCFGKYGEIERVTLLHSFKTQQFRRVGHIIFKTEEAASSLLNSSERHLIDGHEVLCEQCLLQNEVRKNKKGKSKKSRFSKGRTEAVSVTSGANTFKSYDPKKLRKIEEANERDNRDPPLADELVESPLKKKRGGFETFSSSDNMNDLGSMNSRSPRHDFHNNHGFMASNKWDFPSRPSGDIIDQRPNFQQNSGYGNQPGFPLQGNYGQAQPGFTGYGHQGYPGDHPPSFKPGFGNGYDNGQYQGQLEYGNSHQNFQMQPQSDIYGYNSTGSGPLSQNLSNKNQPNPMLNNNPSLGSHLSNQGLAGGATMEYTPNVDSLSKNEAITRLKELRKRRDLIDREIEKLESVISRKGGDPRIDGYPIDGPLDSTSQ